MADYLDAPLEVLVENVATDGGFLAAASARLPGRQLFSALQKRRGVAFRQAGGIGEIPKEAERLKADRPTCPSGLPPRLFVLSDSDCDPVTGDPHLAARAVATRCQELGLPYHVWLNRAIENYVHDEAISQYVASRRDRAAQAAALSALPQVDRDRVDVKQFLGDFMKDFLEVAEPRLGRDQQLLRDPAGEVATVISRIEEIL
ncbi:MAG: hypothetical protein ACRC0L_11185 [Angustibacter sp.]